MPLSVQDAMASYGYVWQIANAIPELRGILTDAMNNTWAPAKLEAMVESSPWWMQHSDTARNLAIQAAAEPGTYQQTINNAKNLVWLKVTALGRTSDDATVTRLAIQTLTENASWDDQRLNSLVANSTGIFHGENNWVAGNAANLQDKMSQLMRNYGQPVGQGELDWWTSHIQQGWDTVDGFESLMRSRAKAKFPPLAGQIDAGMTVRDIADPYVQTMAKTLEVPETGITLDDPYVQRALTSRAPDGTPTIQPLWDFSKQLRDDPRYDKTTQAKSDAMQTLGQLGKAFGFYTGG